MIHQTSFAQAEFAERKKITWREKFLARMEAILPWAQLLAVIAPHYPKGERGDWRRTAINSTRSLAWPTR